MAGTDTGGQRRNGVAARPEGVGRGNGAADASALPFRVSPTMHRRAKHALVMKTIVAAGLSTKHRLGKRPPAGRASTAPAETNRAASRRPCLGGVPAR